MKEEFNQLKTLLDDHLQDMIIAVEHVGSTSIEGLLARAILDVDVIIKSYYSLPAVIKRLEALGYFLEGDFGIKGRETFGRENGEFKLL